MRDLSNSHMMDRLQNIFSGTMRIALLKFHLAHGRTAIRMRHSLSAMAVVLGCHAIGMDATIASPDWVKELNSPRAGDHPSIGQTTLDYTLSWKGTIHAGTLRMEFDPKGTDKPGRTVIKTTAQSTGAASKLFPYSHHFWAEVNRQSLKPVFFQGQEIDRKETSTTRVHYFPDRVESHEQTVRKKGGKLISQNLIFHHQDVHNLFSAMLHIRSQDLRDGSKFTVLCQPFDNPYLVTVHSHGIEEHRGRGAIRCSVWMRKINRKTLELQEYKKMRGPATLWLTNDADRVILEVRAAVFIGDVRATLVDQQKP